MSCKECEAMRHAMDRILTAATEAQELADRLVVSSGEQLDAFKLAVSLAVKLEKENAALNKENNELVRLAVHGKASTASRTKGGIN
jgi:hypothetical protein